MNNRYRVLFLVIFIIIFWKTVEYFNLKDRKPLLAEPNETPADQNLNVERIKVTIYYEALCSDSRNFILKQLKPAYEILPDYLLLDFVPYGKAETVENDNIITFKCQHGSTECIANKIHACVLDLVKEQDVRLKYVACMINDNMIPHEAGQKCADELGIEYGPIMDCANDERGSKLLKIYGKQTHAVSPVITFIPTIQINDATTISQAKLLKNLPKELCNLLESPPKECPQ